MVTTGSLTANGFMGGLRPVAAEPSMPRRRTARPQAGLLRRLFVRRRPSTYERCLAVHMYFAGRSGALD